MSEEPLDTEAQALEEVCAAASPMVLHILATRLLPIVSSLRKRKLNSSILHSSTNDRTNLTNSTL